MTDPARAPNGRLEALTGLRGLAAWYVVCFHIRLSLIGIVPAPIITALGKGYLAVDLFFMLSGFVLWISNAPRLGGGGMAAARAFWWRRVARIWPLHGLLLAGFVALAALFALTGRNTADYPLHELPLHVLLMQNWGFTPALVWNRPAWSISTEMAAYLLFPLLVAVSRKPGPRRHPAAMLIGASALLLVGIYGLYALHGRGDLSYKIAVFGLARCLLEFTLGTLAARLWLLWHDRPWRLALSGCLALVSFAGPIGGSWLGLPETAYVPLALWTGLIALTLADGPALRWLATGPVHWLGQISYSTYLCHYGLFVGFKLLFVDASLQLGLVQFASFIGLLLFASAALYHGVELPAQRALNAVRWPRRRQPGPGGASLAAPDRGLP